MQEKKCTKCGETKELSGFYRDKNKQLGVFDECKKCSDKRRLDYYHSIHGLASTIYSSQKRHSKNRGDVPPNYTKQQLEEWLNSQPNIEILFEKWVKSGFKKALTPSCDRLNNYMPYSFGNIRLTTWAKNELKGRQDIKNGINNKQSRAIIAVVVINGAIEKYYSIHQAARETCANLSNIWACCNKKIQITRAGNISIHQTSKGRRWYYKEDYNELKNN